jgi:hypothetical protein
MALAGRAVERYVKWSKKFYTKNPVLEEKDMRLQEIRYRNLTLLREVLDSCHLDLALECAHHDNTPEMQELLHDAISFERKLGQYLATEFDTQGRRFRRVK